MDSNDNELAYLEAIHLFVEVLGESSYRIQGGQNRDCLFYLLLIGLLGVFFGEVTAITDWD